MICPKCNAEMHEKEPFCFICGYRERYLKSRTPLANYVNTQILMLKSFGFIEGLVYLICSFMNFITNKVPWIIKSDIEFRRLKRNGKVLNPPWCQYPEIGRGSIGWRMGYGEEYLIKWDRWYDKLSNDDRSHYQNRFQQPKEWEGFYRSREK